MHHVELDTTGAMAAAVGAAHGVSPKEWEACARQLNTIHAQLLKQWANGELGFAQLPDDRALIGQILQVATKVRHRFSNLVVVGIGGSSLGFRALAHALLNPTELLPARLERRGTPQLYFCENIDPDYFGALVSQLDWRETCINVISKSGKTMETAAQFLILRELLERKLGSQRWKDHVIVTTDPATGPLRAMVVCEQLPSFAIPPAVSGRFSVLSAVGLFPAACVGLDVRGILDGARQMAASIRDGTPAEHPAYRTAGMQYLLDTRHGKTINVVMPYAEGLQRFAEWVIQLTAESLGKKGKGQTPIKAIGATDQHAQLQLFIDGPNNKSIELFTIEDFFMRCRIPPSTEPAWAYLSRQEMGEVLNVAAESTRQALLAAGRPVLQWRVPRLEAAIMGQLLFCREWQTVVSAALYGVNAFDQPGIEMGKRLSRERLVAHAAAVPPAASVESAPADAPSGRG